MIRPRQICDNTKNMRQVSTLVVDADDIVRAEIKQKILIK